MKKIFVLSCFIASLTFIHSCSRNPVTGKRQVALMSEANEIALGQSADPQIIAQYGLYQDTALQNFVTQRGKQLAAVSHRPNLEYHFRIVDSEVLNAFAVPGGYVYFTRGIMASFNDEAQFMGVLGHEIGHITARHSVVQQRNATFAQLGIIAGVIINPELGRFADAASQGLGLLFLKFGRDDERESDRLGVEYSTKLKYDAKRMGEFFVTLERSSAQAGAAELPDFLATHPNPGDRYQTVTKLATEWQQKENLTNAIVNRNSYLRRLEGLIYGEDPRQGFLENNVFYHPEMRFQFPVPAGWNYANTPQVVQVAPKDGKALMMLMLAQGTSLEQAASGMIQKYQLQVVNSRNMTVNGFNAMEIVADQKPQQQTQQAQVIRTLSYLIQYNNNIYHLIGIAGLNDFNNYVGSFTNTMQNFRQLTDQSKINKQPERIRIKTVNTTMTLDKALRSYNVPQARLEQHAIMNGMKLTDNVAAGTMIKIVAN
jgi:predicted Zn-dependent protease